MKQTENLQLPILQSGDKYTKETQNEAFEKVDLHLSGLAKRVNNIVASGGESNIEIVDARRDNNTGVVYNTLGERIDTVSEQLDTKTSDIETINSQLDTIALEKADKTQVWSMSNMGQDVKEAMTGGSVAVVEENSILNDNIVDNQIRYMKTDFLERGKNIVDTNNLTVGIVSQLGVVVSEGVGVDNYYTTDFIKISANANYIGRYVRKFVAYNINKEVIPSSFINNDNHTSTNVIYNSTQDGYIKLSFRKDLINNVQLELGTEPTSYEPFYYYFKDIKNGIKNKSLSVNKVDFIEESKNKFNKNIIVQGYILMNGELSPIDNITKNYSTSDFIYIEQGKTYTVNNIRKMLFFTELKGITTKYIDEKLTTYTFTAENCGYVRFSFKTEYLDIIQFEESPNPTTYEDYGYKYNIPIIQENKEINKLKGKTIYAFGTSITWGHLTGYSYIDYLSSDNEMTATKYARNGNRVIGSKDKINTILWQIDGASTVSPDFIIFDGLANDCYNDQPRGTITRDFNNTLDEATFCGAFESICKTLMNKYLGVPIIYVNVHKLVGRENSIQNEFQDLAVQICKKWGVHVVDLYHEGMNTFIESIKLEYSYNSLTDNKNGGGTHPNEAGYRKYYCPLIKSAMESLI